MVKITQVKGHPGAGKTLRELDSMINVPGKYVYAGSRTALIDEAIEYLRKHGIRCEIEAIYADQDGRGSKNVDERMEAFIKRNSDSPHVILLITHAALRDADQRQFEGYQLVVDEIPAGAVLTDSLHARASLPALQQLFKLTPDPANRNNVMVLRARPGNVHDLLADPFLKPLSNLWKRARTGTVYIECAPRNVEGSDIMDPWADIAKRPCSIVSVWSLMELTAFDRVRVLAAGFETSLVNLCCPASYEIEELRRPPSKAKIRIRCFETKSGGSSSYFSSPTGKHNLGLFARYLSNRTERPTPHGVDPSEIAEYWTCNSSMRDFLTPIMPAGWVSPMQEGSNRLRSATSCIALYSAKRTPADHLLCRLFELTSEQIECAREWEHLNQFVLRGAVRNHDFKAHYDIYVHDLAQAGRLAGYLREIGFLNVQVDLLQLEGKLGMPEARKSGRRPLQSREETLAKKRARNARDYSRRRKAEAANSNTKPDLP